MARWDSTNHSIGDVRDWAAMNKLEIMPDFQRRAVWSDAARVMLIDTVLQNIPMPKFYLRRSAREGSTHRQVIDGQQRIRAMLDFLRGDLVLAPPCSPDLCGKGFEDLSEEQQGAFLNYQLDMNEFTEASDEEVREVYSRVNKYMKQLNKQELRRADFPGDFLEASERLSLNEKLDEFAVFTPANRRRMGDVEFTSELLAFLVEGEPLDKKDKLDVIYQRLAMWPNLDREAKEAEFEAILMDISSLFSGTLSHGDMPLLRRTRFNQKSDFYTLFSTVAILRRAGGTLHDKDLLALRDDLFILYDRISPSSEIELLKSYAIRCVSDANSVSSRRWRIRLLESVLSGTFLGILTEEQRAVLAHMLFDLQVEYSDFCRSASVCCPITEEELEPATPENAWVAWHRDARVFQMSNAFFISKEADPIALEDWHLVRNPVPQLVQEARRA